MERPKLIGPPIYRPQQVASSAQPRVGGAPPVYCPTQIAFLQTALPQKPKLIGPPVYRPYQTAAPTQPKVGGAPPVYRPTQIASAQTALQQKPKLIGPPVYRPTPQRKPVQQGVDARPHSIQRTKLLLADRPWGEVEELEKTIGHTAVVSGALGQIPTRRLRKWQRRQVEQKTLRGYHVQDSDITAQLRSYIEAARDAYLRGDYEAANKMLLNQPKAKEFGLSIDVGSTKHHLRYYSEEELKRRYMSMAVGGARSYESGKMELPYAFLRPCSETDPTKITRYWQHPELAKSVIPVYLEEWMHQLQRKIRRDQGNYVEYGTGGFLSGRTAAFRAGVEFKKGVREGAMDANWNEVDILAAFEDWGLPVEELGTVEQYPDRKHFRRRRDALEEGEIDL